MKRALEEHVMGAIDALFRGALFLRAGDTHEAERLLEDTVLAAYHEWERGVEPPDEDALLVLMARTFLSQSRGDAEAAVAGDLPPSTGDGTITADDVCAAAGAVAPPERAALWLVVIQRWRYARAAAALRIDEAELRRRIGFRDRFAAALAGLPSPRIAGLDG